MQIIISAEFVEIIPYPWSDLDNMFFFLSAINKYAINKEKRIKRKREREAHQRKYKTKKKEQKPN